MGCKSCFIGGHSETEWQVLYPSTYSQSLWSLIMQAQCDSSETKNEFKMKLAASLLAVIVCIEMHEEMIFTFEGP